MTGKEREAFARGVSVGCAFGYAVGSESQGETSSTAAELAQLLADLDQVRRMCGCDLNPVEIVREALMERLAEASITAIGGHA